MPKRFRDLPGEAKASRAVDQDARDGSIVYCPACGRAMEQGDCVVDDNLEEKLRCAYGDCILDASIAMHSLTAWDSYRELYAEQTTDWPDTPVLGECYRPSGDIG